MREHTFTSVDSADFIGGTVAAQAKFNAHAAEPVNEPGFAQQIANERSPDAGRSL